jgi:hypothetical protein
MAFVRTHGLAFKKLAIELGIQNMQDKSIREQCKAISY